MRYENLSAYLLRQRASEIPMTFAEVEAVIGRPLPASARRHRAWWSNNSSNSVMTQAWLRAGFRTERVDMGGERLVFRKAGQTGSASAAASPDEPLSDLYGCMEGTVRFLHDVDLAAPTGERWRAEGE